MHGVVSPSHWIAWKAGLSSAHAQQLVTVARRRDEFPVTFAAFDAGELSLDQVVSIATRAPRWADAELCEFAKLATVTQLRRVLRSYDFPPDPTTDDDQSGGARREPVELLELWHGDDGRWELRGELDADHGAILNTALREAQDALFQRDGVVASKVDALVEIANRSLDSITDTARRDRYRVHVHRRCRQHDARRARLPPPRMAPRSDLLRQLRVHRPRTRRHPGQCGTHPAHRPGTHPTTAWCLRDRGCRVPGCTADQFLHVHHVIHWDPDDGNGPTDTWNLACLCPRHHRLHHQGRLGISGNADDPHGLVFTDSLGRVMHPAAVPRPPTGPPPQPTGRYQHPLGERLQMHWVTFNPPRTPAPRDTN